MKKTPYLWLNCLLLAAAILFKTVASGQSAASLCLDRNWKLARVPDVPQAGAQISQLTFNDSAWIPAVVPGTVLTSYQNAGMIPDPYYGTNMDALQFSGYYDVYYWYRDAFDVPASYSGQKVWLNFDGINWKAQVFVNGSYLGMINGPFTRGKFDVTSLLNPGTTNVIAVQLYWANGTVYDSPTFIGVDSWDFMPVIAGRDVGIYQKVYLSTSGAVNIVNPFIKTALPLPGTSPANLTLQVGLTNTSSSAVSGTLMGTITPDGIQFQTNITVAASSSATVTFSAASFPQLSVTNPLLWWPNGYGPHNLHNLQLTYQVGTSTSDVENVSFGIRQYTYNTNGVQLQVSCNGVPIMCKGGNWGMADAMLKYTPDEIDTAVQLHRQMNFTMIRCWHGNSDLDEFYNACDKDGIMVWDEFWLNGSNYGLGPANTNMFIANSIDKFERLRNRACLAVWCGENEAVPQAILQLPQSYSNYDNTRIYIDASDLGPVHGGGPYSLQGPQWYFQNANGFTTEIGLPSVPVEESMEAMMPSASLWPLGDTNWLIHNWATDIGNKGLSGYTNAIASEYGPVTGIPDFCEKAQLLNLENYKAIFEGWNAQLFTSCSGVLVWMSQPAWPSLIWQTYDWYFDQGGAFFGCKKACEPIHIQWNCYSNYVSVVNATTQSLSNAKAIIQVYNLNGALAFSTNFSGLFVPPDTVTNFFTLFKGINGLSSVHFIKLALTDNSGNRLSDNFYWRGTTYLNYTALNSLSSVSPVSSASYRVTNGNTTITATFTNTSSEVAFAARLQLLNQSTGIRVSPALFSDNFFSLVPGDSKTVTVQFTNNTVSSGALQLLLTGWNIPTQQVLTLTITPAIPALSEPTVTPRNSVAQGTAVMISCTNLTGADPSAFQWQFSANGIAYTNIGGANLNTLSIPAATIFDSGYYQLVVMANGQSVTSSVAPLTVSGSPLGARLSIKFAADKDYNDDTVSSGEPAGVLNSTIWFDCYGINGGSSGTTNITFYASNNVPESSQAVLVYNWANEINDDNEQAAVPNNFALMDSFINVNNNCWYLSVTNLDAVFTNGYRLYFYYFGGVIGWGGQNYVRFYSGQTTKSPVRGIRQWNLYTTTTNNDGHFTLDSTPSSTGTSGETPGANYIVFTNLSGGAFDLLITNGNYGGASAIEIVANPFVTTNLLSVSTNRALYGATITFTNMIRPAPADGESVVFSDGGAAMATNGLSGGVTTYSTSAFGVGTHSIQAAYGGDGNYLGSTSSVLTVTITPSLSMPAVLPSANVFAGTAVTLVCSNYDGTPPYSFQWQASRNGNGFANFNGATTNFLVLPNVTTNATGDYQLIFGADSLWVTSAVVSLTVNALPEINVQWQGDQMILSWPPSGILLQTTNLLGPWITNNAASPFTNQPLSPQMFYRILVQ